MNQPCNRMITHHEIKARLREAGRALRGIPTPREVTALSNLRPCWPDIPPDFWAAYGTEKARYKPLPPSRDEIGRLDETLGWLLKLDSEDRRFVGAWMMYAGWKWICERYHIGRTQGWRRLDSICVRLGMIAEQDLRNAA